MIALLAKYLGSVAKFVVFVIGLSTSLITSVVPLSFCVPVFLSLRQHFWKPVVLPASEVVTSAHWMY